VIEVTQHIPGGTVFHNISPSDPGGSFAVKCDRHNHVMAISHNYFDVGYASKGTLYDLALETLAKCPSCVSEIAYEEQRNKKQCPQEEHDACGCEL
jgi:hypothetical protein